MNYTEAYDSIAKYGDTSTLRKFADRWNRWPDLYTAKEIVDELQTKPEADSLADVIEEILDRVESELVAEEDAARGKNGSRCNIAMKGRGVPRETR